jgi:hypothetical protein
MLAGHQPNPDLATTTNMTGDSVYLPGADRLLEGTHFGSTCHDAYVARFLARELRSGI